MVGRDRRSGKPREKMPLTYLQVMVLALLQGVTELFPVSSLGHAVILPAILLWPLDPRGQGMLPFLVILHLGTALALLVFYRREWLKLLLAVFGLGDKTQVPALRREIMMLIIGTVPAAIAGAAFNKMLRENFAQAAIASIFLVINGVVLFIGDRRHRLKTAGAQATPGKPMSELTVWDALIIGLAQCTALIPGISRSGVTIVTGLGRKLTADAAAHFSFLLATPIIAGAAVLEIPKLLHAISTGHADADYLTKSIAGGIVAGIAAFISVAFLTRYFRVTEIKMMRPFALYCVLAGAAALALFLFRG
jgi:undecaprenyl-diphosphatase